MFSAQSVCRLSACKVSMSIVLSVCSLVMLVSELCMASSNRALLDLSSSISSFIYTLDIVNDATGKIWVHLLLSLGL